MAHELIQPGRELVLESYNGHTVRVRAESEPWENSKGIEGFDATLLEEYGNKESGDFKIMQLHLYDVIGGVGIVQCESCGKLVDEGKAEFDSYPGADLAFCEACARPFQTPA